MTSTPTPTSKNVRLTISVTPEVHATFQRLAKASGMSISRAMGEWLGDTVEAAEFMADKVEQARAAPGLVMREMHAYALGLADETTKLIDDVKQRGIQHRANTRATVIAAGRRATEPQASASARRHPTPPSSNTGGKGQARTISKGGKVS